MLIAYLLSVYALCAFGTMVIIYHRLKDEDPCLREANAVGAIWFGIIWPFVLFYAIFKFLLQKTEKFIYGR